MLTIFYLIMLVLLLTLLVGVIISIKKKIKYRKLLIALLVVVTLISGGVIVYDYIKTQEYEDRAYEERHKNDKEEENKINEVINLLNDIIYDFKDPKSVSIMSGAKRNGCWVLRIRATNSFGGYVNDIFAVYNGKLETEDTINSQDKNFINNLNDYYEKNGDDEVLTEENIAEINGILKAHFE